MRVLHEKNCGRYIFCCCYRFIVVSFFVIGSPVIPLCILSWSVIPALLTREKYKPYIQFYTITKTYISEPEKLAKNAIDPPCTDNASYLFLDSFLFRLLLCFVLLGSIFGGLILLLLSAERNPTEKIMSECPRRRQARKKLCRDSKAKSLVKIFYFMYTICTFIFTHNVFKQPALVLHDGCCCVATRREIVLVSSRKIAKKK
jgi:hypothetical protein